MLESLESSKTNHDGNIVGGDGDTPLLDNGDDDNNVVKVIKNGKSLDKNFWEHFIQMCNNDDFVNLLKLKSDQVSEWVSIIRNGLKKIDNKNLKKQNTVIDTGSPIMRDQGPTTTYPNDTKPM